MAESVEHGTGPGTAETMEKILLEAITETLEESMPEARRRQTVSLGDNLDRDLGLDSLTRAELLVNVERTFGVQLPEQLLSDADTPQDILKAIYRLKGEPPNKRRDDPAAGAVGEAEDQAHFSVPEFQTLQEALQWHAREHPQRTYLHWVKSEEDVEPLTFGELHHGALRVANGLLQHGIEQRETVALMLPTSLDYFYSFFGALYAGTIPVPLYPPMRASQIEEHLRRQAAILNNAQARIMVTVPEARKLAQLVKALVPSLTHIVTIDEVWHSPLDVPVAGVRGEDIAFLQYTSGSTGDPKGVMLSHANLLANIGAGNEVLQVDQDDVFVSWLPLYHDMGLIGTCLSSLWYGMRLVIMSPLLFLTKPRYWLWAIDRFRGTLAPAPNFGYELCLKRLKDEDLEGMDLSCWRVAFNGAEAVSPDTVSRFSERFSTWGFRADAMAPVYGLAENCVALTFPEAAREPLIDYVDRDRFTATGEAVPAAPDTGSPLRFVACGKAVPNHRIRIIDREGKPLPERREGELQFTGPSATRGYFRNPEKTAALFDGDWLNTGDRGYLAEGELYITGRTKDLIIRAGRNLYPGEIEEAIGALEPVRSGCVAAFAAGLGERSGEKLVVVAETHETDTAKRQALKEEIARLTMSSLGIDVDDIVLVPPRTVPKTSSGKLRRNDCRLRYERGELEQQPVPVWRQVMRLAGSAWRSQSRRSWQGLGRWLYAGWAWLAFVMTGLSVLLLVNLVPRKPWRWQVARRGAQFLGLLTGTRLKVEGAEKLKHLPAGCVIVANHASYIDALVMAALFPRPVSFVAKIELLQYAWLRRFLRLLDVETVERGGGEHSVRASQRIAKNARGKRLLFFAEGTFDTAPGLKPFRMGAFMTAAVLGVPVVPVTLKGTRRKLPPDNWDLRPGPVEAVIGDPIEPVGDNWRSAVQLRDRVREVILAESGEPDRLRG